MLAFYAAVTAKQFKHFKEYNVAIA